LSAQKGDVGRKPVVARELGPILARLETRTGLDPALHDETVDLLRTNPQLQAEIPGLLAAGKASLTASETLIGALGDVGTPPAQQALAAIQSDSSLRHMDRLRAVMTLGAVDSVTEDSVGSLWSLAAQRSSPDSVDLSPTALLALGAAGSRLGSAAPERHATLCRELVSRLRTTPDPNERAIVLKAVGNLQDPALGSVVVESLFDDSVPVRYAAAQTVGSLHDVSNRDLLAMLLPAEPRGVVRSAMVEGLRQLPANELSLRTVNALARTEPDHEARAQMVQYLIEHLAEFEEARATLSELTATAPTQKVRLLASYCLRH